MNVKTLNISDITTDGGTQTRASIDPVTVEEYADIMADSTKNPFPPLVVFFDGSIYWLADGFHRIAAAKTEAVGWVQIECDVRQGRHDDAVAYGMGCNAVHGLRRTNADKRHAVSMALGLWPDLADRAIASMASVSHKLVATVRLELGQAPVERTGLDGKVRRLPRGGAQEPPEKEAGGGKDGPEGDFGDADPSGGDGGQDGAGKPSLNDFRQFQQLVEDIAALCKTMEGLSIPGQSRKPAAVMARGLGTRFAELGNKLLPADG